VDAKEWAFAAGHPDASLAGRDGVGDDGEPYCVDDLPCREVDAGNGPGRGVGDPDRSFAYGLDLGTDAQLDHGGGHVRLRIDRHDRAWDKSRFANGGGRRTVKARPSRAGVVLGESEQSPGD
jgi:hypothetical protein